MKTLIKPLLFAAALIIIAYGNLFAQAPSISYTTPVDLERNVAIGTAPNDAITATNSGGAVAGILAYSNTATQPLTGGSYSAPYRGAVDAAGNIYICNFTNNTISKFTSAGALISNNYTSGGTLSGPSNIVFDSSGNMWILNSNATLLKYNSAGVFQSTTTLTVGGTTKGICIDASNNMYITSYGATDYLIRVTSALVQSTLRSGGNLNDPVEIGISGINLYILNRGNGRVTIYNTSGTAVQATHIATVGTTPEGLAIDAINGYLYLTDITNSRIGVYLLGTGASITTATTITGVTNCRGLFLDGKGNVYAPNYTGNVVNMYRPTALFFINKTLPTGLIMSKTTGAITGTATVNTATADYGIAAYNTTGGSATILNLTVAQYAPNISYANSPAYLKRTVAVGTAPNPSLNLTVDSGALSGTLGYSSTATQPLTGGSYSAPYRGTVDAAGNIYICNFTNNTISKFTSAGALISNNYTSGASLNGPSNIVFDSSGNMFVLNGGNSTLHKYTAAGAFVSTLTVTGSGTARGMCIDPTSNDIYVTVYAGTDRIVKITSSGTAQASLFTGGNLNDPVEIGISGINLYILNRGNGRVTIYNTSGTAVQATHIATVGTTPEGLAIDAINGYLYLTDITNSRIGVYLLGTGASITTATTITGVTNCRGLFLDGKGNVYAPNYTGNVVNMYRPTGRVFINKALPAGLSLSNSTGAITGTATASSLSDYIVTAHNSVGSGSATLKLNTYAEYTWNGADVNGVWQTATNWTPNTVPGPYDRMLIGLGTYTYEPQIATTETIGSITMGTNDNSSVIITVNGTLNVNGDITYQSDAGSSTNNAHIGGFNGTGTVNAANFKMIANTTGLTNAYQLKVNSSVSNFNISGDLSLTTTFASSKANDAKFTVSAGTVTATDFITSNVTGSTSTLEVTGGTLNFTDPTALAGLSANGTNTITLTGGAIGYTGSGAQTVYTTTAITGLPSGISYHGLSFGGSGIKTAASGNLNIAGTFTNSLANDANNYLDLTLPTVQFNGSTQSLVLGSGNGVDFDDVTFTGGSASTKTITSGKFNILPTGVLTIAGTNTTLAAGSALLTLNSDATGSATVAVIPSGGSITGTVNVERYISGDQSYSRGYRLISSPVSVGSGNLVWPNLTYISAKTYTTGTLGATNGFDAVGNPTMYLYRENKAPDFSTFISGNSRGVAKINNGTAYNFNVDGDAGTFNIPAGNGLLLFFRGDKATTVNPTLTNTIAKPTTLTATGYLNQGNVVVKNWFTPGSSNLSYTPSTPVSVRGFNLLGNPYASSIDWDLITGTNVGTTIWVYNPTLKVFSTYIQGNGGVGTNTNGGDVADIIPSGQGFYVKTTAASPALTFTEAHKVNTQVASANIMLAAAPPTTDLKYIRVKIIQDAANKDDALIFFKPGTSSDYTVDEDADYLMGNNVVAISTRVNNRAALAINQMPLPTYKENVNLNVIVPANGTYQLSVPEINDMPTNYDIWIKDWLKKDSVNIKTTPTYSFDAVATDSTTFKRRFSIVITTDPGSAYYLTDFKGQKNGGAVQLTWKTGNEGSTTQFTIQRSNDDGLTYTDLGSFKSNGSGSYSFTDNSPLFFSENLYRLKHVDISGTVAYSGTVPINYSDYTNETKNSIKTYPNPAVSVIKLKVAERRDKNSTAKNYSDYTVTIADSQGTAIKTVNTSQPDTWESDISKFAPGVYLIKVYNNNTKILVGNTKFVKL